MAIDSTRGGAPGSGPVSGCPWPRLDHAGSSGLYPRAVASLVTKTTPVRGTARKACRVESDAGLWIVMAAKGSTAIMVSWQEDPQERAEQGPKGHKGLQGQTRTTIRKWVRLFVSLKSFWSFWSFGSF